VASSLTDLAGELESRARAFVREHRLPGLAAAVVHGRDLVWAGGEGFADVGGRRRPDTRTLYRVASITKTFTGTAIVQLRDAGRLHLDDPAVAYLPELASAEAPFGPIEILGAEDSAALWRSVRTLKPFTAARERPLWRISVAPRRGHELAAAITPAAQMFYDWAGGLIWVAMPFPDEPDAGAVRGAVAAIGGHATLIRAPAAVRAALDVFTPEAPGVAALNKRVKDSFDPRGVLNSGRMWAGV